MHVACDCLFQRYYKAVSSESWLLEYAVVEELQFQE